MVVSANICLKVAPKKLVKLQKIPEKIYKCKNTPFYLLQISIFFGVKLQQDSHLKSIVHLFLHCIFMLHFDLD